MVKHKTNLLAVSIFFLLITLLTCQSEYKTSKSFIYEESRVSVESDGWQLIGDLVVPSSNESLGVVLILNKANGNREVYQELALQLAKRGLASLRLDLRGHGESVNLGKFVPGETQRDPKIWDAEKDVISAYNYLKNNTHFNKIGIIGTSYSGEEMAEAGRKSDFADAYTVISPGSFSDDSVNGIDSSNKPWFFITSNGDPYLQEITKNVQKFSKNVEILVVPGNKHASDLLIDNNNLSERIAIWLEHNLRK